jgi:hypothetical protein
MIHTLWLTEREGLGQFKMATAIRDCSAVYTFVYMVRQGTVLDTLLAEGTPDYLVTNFPLQFICSYGTYG